MKKRIAALLVMLLFTAIIAPAALAQDTDSQTGERQLTLQQAYDIAAKNSRSLKQAQLAVDRALEVKEFRLDNVTYTPSGPTPPEAAAAFTTAAMADMGYQMAVRSKTVGEDSLHLSVMDKYNKLLTAQENLDYSKKSLTNAQLQHKINNLSLALGMTSSIEYSIGDSAFETNKVGLQNAETALEKAYTDFNNLLGINVNERPILLDQPTFEPLAIDDLESTISRTLNQDPTIWLTEQKVDLAAMELDLYSYLNPARDPIEAERIDVETEKLSAMDTRNQMQYMLRTLFNSLQQLEEAYLMKEQAVKIADQTLTLKKLMYDVGMVSEMDMSKAELEAYKAHLDLDQTAYQYTYLKTAFEKPWAYVGSMSNQ